MTQIDKLPVNKLLVVGAGAMGSQIAMVCALAEIEVVVQDVSTESLTKAQESLHSRLDRNVEKNRLTADERDAAFDRMRFTTDLASAAADVDFVIEAAAEILEIKRELFAELDRLCPAHTILTSNSSSFVPSLIADATSRADQICNMHFFNPALIIKGVEVVRGTATSQATMDATIELTERIGKLPIVIDKEINGFAANRIINAIRDEATFLLEGGYASIESIDTACRTALGHPMGPFELQDLTGLDIGYHVRQGRYAESGDPGDQPSRSLTAHFEAGDLGRKTGKGWYIYDADGNRKGENPWT